MKACPEGHSLPVLFACEVSGGLVLPEIGQDGQDSSMVVGGG
jgi:hypothetical protein